MMATLVCVPIPVTDPESALQEAHDARRQGADLVEVRLDEMVTGAGEPGERRAILRLIRDLPLACIATCRPAWEGGAYEGEEAARLELLEAVAHAEHPPRYLDLELGAAAHAGRVVREGGPTLIVSTHDFEGRPADLTRRVRAMQEVPGAGVLKVAFRARSLRDNLELFDLLAERDRPMIALGMGEFGLMSRVLTPKFGGLLTFASLRDESATAPGQPTIRDLLDLYRVRSIGTETRVYGVIGWPIGHSLSPLVHNAGFEAVGHDGVYLPMPVAAGEDPSVNETSLRVTLESLIAREGLRFQGASVTLPFKNPLARLAEGSSPWRRTPEAQRTGAANTLHADAGGASEGRAWMVANTDARAIEDLLGPALGREGERRVGIIGSGGVARAGAVAALELGATVTIFARTPVTAEQLIEFLRSSLGNAGVGMRASVEPLERLAGARCDAYINATPVGMIGGPDPKGLSIPIPEMERLTPDTVLFDTVYNPIETPMLEAARRRGCRTIDGVEMFVRQAAAQFELWTGHAAPMRLFDRLCRETLEDGGAGS